MNKKLLLGVGSVVMALALGLAACAGSTPDASLPGRVTYGNDVGVHDPSIFKDDDGTYYAFGTHYAVASSKDLITWTQVAGDYHPEVLYAEDGTTKTLKSFAYSGKTWPEALKETVELVAPKNKDKDTISSTWAPDVIKIGRKYYMYYSITQEFGSKKSAIGRVEADKVTGPYGNNQVIISTPGTGCPNAIDPTVFYDKDGKLWMVYGSDAMGIYLIELNADGDKVGLPTDESQQLIDQGGYGEQLWQGGGNNVEGPYIFYNAETKYYYLMTSYGSLSSDYNMRVARSKKVTGPYEDISGNDMASSVDKTFGNKLAGNYQFEGDTTWAALGHNSVLVEDGKYLVVCHVRDRVDGGHHLEVRQLFFNEDGWPVLSPNRYGGETIGKVSKSDVAGDYELILHTSGTSAEYAHSKLYTFESSGKITQGGTEVGTWKLGKGYYITIELDGKTYKGVVAPTWIKYQSKAGYAITATLDDGNALWANPAAATR